jgi:hypothetical protein
MTTNLKLNLFPCLCLYFFALTDREWKQVSNYLKGLRTLTRPVKEIKERVEIGRKKKIGLFFFF